jgi:hypothetical protein
MPRKFAFFLGVSRNCWIFLEENSFLVFSISIQIPMHFLNDPLKYFKILNVLKNMMEIKISYKRLNLIQIF